MEDATEIFNLLVEHLHIAHVLREHDKFNVDKELFFKFIQDDRDFGHIQEGAPSWHGFREKLPDA